MHETLFKASFPKPLTLFFSTLTVCFISQFVISDIQLVDHILTYLINKVGIHHSCTVIKIKSMENVDDYVI